MSNRRTLFWLLVICLLTLAANFAFLWKGGGRPAPAPGARLGVSFDPTRIVLERPGERPVALVKTDDTWRLVEPFAASVDEQLVMRLSDALSFCQVEDAITDAELLKLGRTRADFRLEEPPLKVTLRDGKEEASFSFGDLTPSSNGVYVAVAGSDSVLVLPSIVLAAVDLQVSAFRQRGVFPYAPDFVRAFDIKRPTDKCPNEPMLGFSHSADGWLAGDQPASAAKVGELLAQVSAARAIDFVWPVGTTNEADSASTSLLSGYGLDPESAVTIVLKCRDNVDRRLSLGNPAGEKRAYALVQNGMAVVTLDATLREMALQGSAHFTDSRLFPFEADAVKSFTLTDGETDYALVRETEGGWRLEAPVMAAADEGVVRNLLQRALALKSSDFDTEGIRISFLTNTAPVAVARGRLLGNGDVRLENLRSKEILKFGPSQVKRLVATPGKGGKPVAVVYSRERAAWNLEAETDDARGPVDVKGVERVLKAVNPLRAESIVTLKATQADLANYGLDEPHYTLALDPDAEGAVRRNILIGNPKDAGRYATVGSAEAVFVLPPEAVSNLVTRLIADD